MSLGSSCPSNSSEIAILNVLFYKTIGMRQPPVRDWPAASHSDILLSFHCLMLDESSTPLVGSLLYSDSFF